ncbi:hypothetical protein DIE16_31345 [Burkholderia sp. Bp9090]|nr:hypothetical protein DIE16_31345 [Burkholderia sp. Bp9090]
MVIDTTGHVYSRGLSSDGATAMMESLLSSKPALGIKTVRASWEGKEPLNMLATVPAYVPSAQPLPAIEPGSERHALREALEARQDATKRLADAVQAVERAKAFHDARKSEHVALTVAHEAEVRNAGSNLAEAFKAGGSVAANRFIDRSALVDCETRLATSQAALDQLEAERGAAESAERSAESAVRLAIMAVKRVDVDAMTKRLIDVKAEYMALASAIDAARFSDVPTTHEALEAMQIDDPHVGHIDLMAKRWHAYTTALREDPQVTWEITNG